MNYPNLDGIKVSAVNEAMFPDLGLETWIEDEEGNRVGLSEHRQLIRSDSWSMIEYWEQPRKKETLWDGKIY